MNGHETAMRMQGWQSPLRLRLPAAPQIGPYRQPHNRALQAWHWRGHSHCQQLARQGCIIPLPPGLVSSCQYEKSAQHPHVYMHGSCLTGQLGTP